MKRPVFLFFLLLFFLSPAMAEHWEVIKTPTGADLYDIHFPTPTTGYAVGEYGTVIKTTDRGRTWEIIAETKEHYLFGVYFINELTGFVYEDNAKDNKSMWRTEDGGKTWEKSRGAFHYCAYFFDDKYGFAGMGKTTDAGKTWTTGNNNLADERKGSAMSMTFISPSTGFIVGYASSGSIYKGYVLKTTDGGKNWLQQEFGNVDARLISVSFVDDKNGYIVGGEYYLNGDKEKGILMKTTDGGLTWTKTDFFQERNHVYYFWDAVYTEKGTGYIVASDIYKTTDDGETWTECNYSDDSFFPLAISFPNKNTGFAAGWNGKIARLVNDTPIDEAVADGLPAAYPNPARGTVALPYICDRAAGGVLQIFNAGGLSVKEITVDGSVNEVPVDVSEFVPGLYFYSCNGKAGKFTVVR